MVIIMQNQLILPGSLGMSKKYKVLGYICRALLSFICLFGIALLVTDALRLELSLITLFIFCAAYCLLFTLMGINRRCFIGGIVVIVLTAIILLQSERALDRVYFGAIALANAFFRRLASLGYQNMQTNVLRFDSSLKRIGATESECLELIFYILMFILAAVIAASILKRIHFGAAALCRTAYLLGHILLRHERIEYRLFADTFVALRLYRAVGLGPRLHTPPQDDSRVVAARLGNAALAARGARRVPRELGARRLCRYRLKHL